MILSSRKLYGWPKQKVRILSSVHHVRMTATAFIVFVIQAHARAIENQVYVVITGTIGSLPTVDFMRANFGQAAIITPNDIPFPPKGILAEGELNHDMIVTADLDLDLLYQVREKGSVTTWRDRRTDLYPDWEKGGLNMPYCIK